MSQYWMFGDINCILGTVLSSSHAYHSFRSISGVTLLYPFYVYIFKMYLFLVALGLHCCVQAFSSCGKQGLLFVAMCKLLVGWFLVVEQGLQACRHQQLRAQLLCSMWDLPRLGIEPMSPTLAGRFLSPVPPGKPQSFKSLSSNSGWGIWSHHMMA